MNEYRVYKVLVLEDDLTDANLIERQCKKSQFLFKITWATRVSEAIGYLDQQGFDAIVADMNVPDSSGLRTISQLREHCGKSAIIVLTSIDDRMIEKEIFSAGAQDFRKKDELSSVSLGRGIVHAIERQEQVNQIKRLVGRLKKSQKRLTVQSQQLKRKNRRLTKLYRTAREFVDNVSHDLRTPLTVIKDYVSIIRDGMAGSVQAEQMKLLGKVALRTDDLNHMVDDILDASKLESGLLGAWRRTSCTCQLLEHAASLLRERASINGVKLVIDCPQDLPEVYCDCEKAIRVITNLGINAIKHSRSGQTVTIWAKLQPEEGEVRIGITDRGPGIERESLELIFQRFEQLKDQVSSTVQGFGLGLNIAQRLTHINLGKLTVESQVGKGSTFSFTVPLSDPMEVLSRWLALRSGRSSTLRALEIVLDESIPEIDADDFDRFVNCQLRRQDILFRVTTRCWMLIMPIESNEMPMWEQRAERDFVRFNRNRPQGPLPGYSRRFIQHWSPQVSRQHILSEFDQYLSQVAMESERPELTNC
ncbi:response regulator [bacterium]|nr:response regulator [bacterium]